MVRGEDLEDWLMAGGAIVGGEFGGDYLVQSWDAGFQDALIEVSITVQPEY